MSRAAACLLVEPFQVGLCFSRKAVKQVRVSEDIAVFELRWRDLTSEETMACVRYNRV